MSISRRTLALSLSLAPGIGARTLMRVLTRNDLLSRTPQNFLELNEQVLKEEYKLTIKTATNWVNNKQKIIEQAKELEEKLDHLGVHFITAADATYPKKIEEAFPNPPAVLYLYGNTKLLNRNLFAVMSSRNTPPAALDLIEKITEESVKQGEILIGGHSTQEYQRAAVVPLRWSTPRALVLDRGLFKAMGEELSQEPFSIARLWRYEFDPTTDLAISFVSPDKDYFPSCNTIRDQIIGSLAEKIDFIQIKPKGNMEKIARMALEAGKTVRISSYTSNHQEYTHHGAQLINAA